MSRQQRTYTKECKQEAVKLLESSSKPITHIARDLGVSDSALSKWRREYGQQGEEAFPGSGHQMTQDEEIRQLKRSLLLAEQERDVLKKRWPSSRRESSQEI